MIKMLLLPCWSSEVGNVSVYFEESERACLVVRSIK